MTDEEIFQIMRVVVETVTGLPNNQVILADQNGAAGKIKGPYASIRPRQSIRERGQANIYMKDAPDDRVSDEVRAQVICTCSIQFYRGAAMQYAELLKQANKRFDVSMHLFKNKIGWNGTDAVNNLTALQSANQEQRAQINVRLMYEVRNISEVNNILSAGVIIENEKAEVLETIEVPNAIVIP